MSLSPPSTNSKAERNIVFQPSNDRALETKIATTQTTVMVQYMMLDSAHRRITSTNIEELTEHVACTEAQIAGLELAHTHPMKVSLAASLATIADHIKHIRQRPKAK
jgi:hypothetical protein